MRIEGIGLRMVGRQHIQAEPCANQRPVRVRVGIGCQHPALVLMVAEDLHQAAQAELDLGISKVEQLLRPVFRD